LGKIAINVGLPGVEAPRLANQLSIRIEFTRISKTVLFAEENGVSKEDMPSILLIKVLVQRITAIKAPAILNDSTAACTQTPC
jgi:3-hydroxyisobutyrate dehydrogenase